MKTVLKVCPECGEIALFWEKTCHHHPGKHVELRQQVFVSLDELNHDEAVRILEGKY